MILEEKLEYGLITAIVVVLGFVFFKEDDLPIQVERPSHAEFLIYPVDAWQTTDKQGGECVKIRYLVENDKTKLYMVDRNNKVVHSQPITLSPYKDGRERIETYVWRLYRTEWTDRIGPGQYQIIVGTLHEKKGLGLEIEII
jgi:hypothetical protein